MTEQISSCYYYKIYRNMKQNITKIIHKNPPCKPYIAAARLRIDIVSVHKVNFSVRAPIKGKTSSCSEVRFCKPYKALHIWTDDSSSLHARTFGTKACTSALTSDSAADRP